MNPLNHIMKAHDLLAIDRPMIDQLPGALARRLTDRVISKLRDDAPLGARYKIENPDEASRLEFSKLIDSPISKRAWV